MSQSQTEIRVLMMPDYRPDNPYQTLLANALEAGGVSVYFPWGYRRVLPIFRMATEKRAFYQVLHLHWIAPYLKGNTVLVKAIYSLKFLLDILLTRGAGIKIVWTVHNQVSHDTPFPRLEKWTRRILSRLADRIIIHHQSMVEAIAHDYQFPPDKAVSIPIGHYRDVYPSPIPSLEARQALNLPTTGTIYLNQGMIRPYKGIDRLIQVWANHPARLQGHTLIIAGRPLDPIYGMHLQNLATGVEGLQLKLEFIEDQQMAVLFSAADVVVLPFERILTSSSLLVAMSFGKPVIAPKLGGVPEVLGKASTLLYDSMDDKGLSGALQKSTEIDLHRLSQLTIQECNQLDWEAIAHKTKLAYAAPT